MLMPHYHFRLAAHELIGSERRILIPIDRIMDPHIMYGYLGHATHLLQCVLFSMSRFSVKKDIHTRHMLI